MIWSVHEGRGRTPFMSTKGHEGPRRKPLRDHDLVCPRRAGENTFFDLVCPRRATKGHEENLCGIMIWSVHEGRGRTPFLIHEGPRRTTKNTSSIWSVHERGNLLRDHDLVCPRRVGENTFFIHEGPRRKPLRDHDLVCPRRAGENTFFDPRRATKDHEENLCGIMIWSVHEGRGRTPFMSTKGHEGPRRKPLRDHDLVCPRRAGENTFFPRRATKDHEEYLFKIMIWSVHEGNTFSSTKGHEGPRRIPLQDHDLVCPRRAGENTFLIHEGPRRTTKNTSSRS